MTSKKLCELCTEYYPEEECEIKESCDLRAILTENERLKAENQELEKKIRDMNWDRYPESMGR